MNRRNFFRRTVGAAIAGFVAPLVAGHPAKPWSKRWMIPIIYRRRINPAWVDAGKGPHWDMAEGIGEFRWVYRSGEVFPKNAGECIRRVV
jgi:hypothetical protein